MKPCLIPLVVSVLAFAVGHIIIRTVLDYPGPDDTVNKICVLFAIIAAMIALSLVALRTLDPVIAILITIVVTIFFMVVATHIFYGELWQLEIEWDKGSSHQIL